ncbi:hypothetical protein J6590_030031 [Homalodisca vitripennis]|nr:hypothetical protein J6590_030031 [Homalodisca vitripennis]
MLAPDVSDKDFEIVKDTCKNFQKYLDVGVSQDEQLRRLSEENREDEMGGCGKYAPSSATGRHTAEVSVSSNRFGLSEDLEEAGGGRCSGYIM